MVKLVLVNVVNSFFLPISVLFFIDQQNEPPPTYQSSYRLFFYQEVVV